MPLSRLDNFLKNARGNILYVSPNDLDATDSIENQGNSLARPFKTIQRALIESARFSYQSGLDNDRFSKTTILLYPGEHIVDNRPGWIPVGANSFKLRDGTTSSDLPQWDLTTNYDLNNTNNALYKMNSVRGGVILPRGTSIVGLDLRKTKIRPKYVPNPALDTIERSAIFRVTGTCYLWQFTIFDADPNGVCYKDYTTNTFVPNFSHHKLTCFEYADGVNDVEINDGFLSYSGDRTDLEMYYEKVGIVYGPSSGREIQPDYPSASLDIQPKVDEYRIVGPTAGSVGISSIKAGNGITATPEITVELDSNLEGLSVDTAFQISGISAAGYNGQFVVTDVLAPITTGKPRFKYIVSSAPAVALPSVTGSTVQLNVDTVTSASPYIFNISLRSVFGVCGMHADGSKATGFKSMVVAQFTGIGLQKDKNAFLKYDEQSGEYKDQTFAGNENINTDSNAIYNPSYKNFHIKATNNSVIQAVSIFAIGYAEHFVTESGGDISITNSNSNFGAKALVANGFRNEAFTSDNVGYISHIIPPRQIEGVEVSTEFDSIDVPRTVGIASTSRLYIYNQTNIDIPPNHVIEGFRIGAKTNDRLNVLISQSGITTQYSARIAMPNTANSANVITEEKNYLVGRAGAANSITANTFTLTENHTFINGESIRVIAEDGHLPDGLEPNRIYYAITSGISSNQVKIAQTLNKATEAQATDVYSSGGVLHIVSRVSDKSAGELGHPIQFDSSLYTISGTANQVGGWYINVGTAVTDNDIYPTVVSLGTTSLGSATPRTFITRKQDTRNLIDTIYRARFVLPAGTGFSVARPPVDGYVTQNSSSTTGLSTAEIQQYIPETAAVTISNETQLRNFRFIANASESGGIAFVSTELPHNLKVGAEVKITNVKSTGNTVGSANSGYNGTYTVIGISSAKQFTVSNTKSPGTFTNNTADRGTTLPHFTEVKSPGIYQIYRSQEVQKYIPGKQNGIYQIIFFNSSNSPTSNYFSSERYSQNIQNLYPQTNRDNPESDVKSSISAAVNVPIGRVVTNDPRYSLTKETLESQILDFGTGIGVTSLTSVSAGTAHTIFTSIDHGLNRLTKVSIANSGAGYGSGSAAFIYNAILVGTGSSSNIAGRHATARIYVNASGNIDNLKIMDGGSGFNVGDSLTVVGVATTSGFSAAGLTVNSIYSNVGDIVTLRGVTPYSNDAYNTSYRITGISTHDRQIQVSSIQTIGITTVNLTGSAVTRASVALDGKSSLVSSLSYDNVVGVCTVITSQAHGFRVDNKIRIFGADSSLYNSEFVVKKINSLTSFDINIGITTSSPATTGTIFVYRPMYSSQGGVVNEDNENLAGRALTEYAGITTTLSADILTSTATTIDITNIDTLDINIGDYLQIGEEILRVKTTVSTSNATGKSGLPSNPITVLRGVLATRPSNSVISPYTHGLGAIVRKIKPRPIEFRRNSISRASSHTFEYVGFGPGNYSTALPEKQDRSISPSEELLSQSTKQGGGINVFTGMNNDGDFYIGNKKVSSATGQEEVFDSPVPSVVGEDIASGGLNIGFDVLTPLEISINRSLRVEGGPDGNIISEFDGPVIFNNKITSNSEKGIEANSLFLQGDATVSRKQTIGISTPVLAGNPGDITWNANPDKGGYLAWVYTRDNDWKRSGYVSLEQNQNIPLFDKVGIGSTSPKNNQFLVGSGTTQFSILDGNVGVGTTANVYKMNVNGNVGVSSIHIRGALFDNNNSAGGAGFVLKSTGTGVTFADLGSIYNWSRTALNDGIYNTDLDFVGIGTTVPRFNIEIGAIGSASTTLHVNGTARFVGLITANNIFVGGGITATSYNLGGGTGLINAGIVTASTLNIGTGSTTLMTSGVNVGVGTATPRAKFDVEGHSRFKTYSEAVGIATINASGVVTLDLLSAQTFTLSLTANVTEIKVINPPNDSTAFSLKVTQDAVGERTVVGLNTFKNSVGGNIEVYWGAGGVVPGVTTIANRTDIFSFKTFDSGSSFYGVVGGQNFL